MVVVTEYSSTRTPGAPRRATARTSSRVEVGTGGHDWSRLPVEPGPLAAAPRRPAGVRRITFEGDGDSFTLGDVEFEFSSAA